MGMLLLGPKRIMDMADEVGCTSCLCKDIETKINISVSVGTSHTEHENVFFLLSLDLYPAFEQKIYLYDKMLI